LTGLLNKLPPIRVLLGAAVGLASYLVSSVWKANIDDDIGKYTDIINRASAIDSQLSAFTIFQTTSRYWENSIEMQKLQANLLRQLDEAKKSEPLHVVDSYNMDADRAVMRIQAVTIEFFSNLPTEIQLLKADPNVAELDPSKYQNSTATVLGCIASAEFVDKYGDAIAKFPDLEVYPKTFRDAVTHQFNRIAAGYDAGAAILSMQPTSQHLFFSSDPSLTFATRRSTAMACLATARDWTLDYLADLSRFLRAAVRTKFVAPLQATKHRIEIAEIFLYVLGGLIALTGQIGATRAPNDKSRET
jgi:hypothetical protein